jgi:isocitrate dehydrogenase
MYWAQELAAQTDDLALQAKFTTLAQTLTEQEKTIVAELNSVQGQPVDIGGYYYPSQEKVKAIMCPSATFNAALASAA